MHITLPPPPPSHPFANDTIAFPANKSPPPNSRPYNVAAAVKLVILYLLFRSIEGPEVPNNADATNPKLSTKEHYEPGMPPLTNSESSPISSPNVLNNSLPKDPSMFHFIFMNIAHLISKTNQNLNSYLIFVMLILYFYVFVKFMLHFSLALQVLNALENHHLK